MGKIFYIIILFFLPCMGQAQDLGVIEGTNGRTFCLKIDQDSINFIKIDSGIVEPKPVIIMLQGSLPIPLAIKYPTGISFTSFPYRLSKDVLESYHLLAISMPDIPILVGSDEIDNRGLYKDVPASYNRRNYLVTYVERANAVIDYIADQEWFNGKDLILLGHSQGTYVAIKVANSNSVVSKVGVTGFSPNGRFQQYLRQVRYQEHSGQISNDEAQAKIDEYYERWKHIAKNRADDTQERGDTFKATFSFSESFVDDILALNIPIFIAYGTKDIGTLGCDLLPIEFERMGKTDYEMKAYPGLGHNFEEIDEGGRSNFDKMHWDEVFASFVDWMEK